MRNTVKSKMYSCLKMTEVDHGDLRSLLLPTQPMLQTLPMIWMVEMLMDEQSPPTSHVQDHHCEAEGEEEEEVVMVLEQPVVTTNGANAAVGQTAASSI